MEIFVRNWVPLRVARVLQNALDYLRPAPWEYVPEGWRTPERIRGWNVQSIARQQQDHWSEYVESLSGAGPLGINHEDHFQPNSSRLRDHNTLISYAFALAMAARKKPCLSLLDWGGGIGHYYALSKALLCDTEIDYFCHDLPAFCRIGREVLPQGKFVESAADCFRRKYDLVLASSSLWYEEDWRSTLDKLIGAADPYLYVTRMVFVEKAASYVAIQRPSGLGYETEYLCWILNREEFLEYVLDHSMKLVREFLICNGPEIFRAPEQGDYRGYLFVKSLTATKN
jgi:putative methyltransferase (TIGR04325 family)